ncbi:MAG TPA: DUF6069 family protein [Egicoccus sp.]|nr:DUF6069 family protein [Egicoccus sp.]HSK25105.1 DUF6069 family protein [Egicoccus sp.]
MTSPGTTARTRAPIRALAVLAAVLLPVLVWLVAVEVLGIEVSVPDGDGRRSIGLPAVVTTAGIPAVAGWSLLVVLERFSRHAALIWTVVAVAVLLVSFAPLAGAGMPTGTVVTFALMRLTLAGALIPGLLLGGPP